MVRLVKLVVLMALAIVLTVITDQSTIKLTVSLVRLVVTVDPGAIGLLIIKIK